MVVVEGSERWAEMVRAVYEKKVLELLTSQGRLFTIAAFCCFSQKCASVSQIYGSSKLAVRTTDSTPSSIPRSTPPLESIKKGVAECEIKIDAAKCSPSLELE